MNQEFVVKVLGWTEETDLDGLTYYTSDTGVKYKPTDVFPSLEQVFDYMRKNRITVFIEFDGIFKVETEKHISSGFNLLQCLMEVLLKEKNEMHKNLSRTS